VAKISVPSCFKRRVYDLKTGELIYQIDVYQIDDSQIDDNQSDDNQSE